MTIDTIKRATDLEQLWPATLLLDAFGFITKVRGRIEERLISQNASKLSLRELMDMFLSPALDPPFDKTDQFWSSIPMLHQRQFGPISLTRPF